jgi:CelD/BcsL family acetyltransferase involved in cellulose biosynthesis
LSLLCRPDRQTQVASAVADWLTAKRTSTAAGEHWDLLELSDVDAEDGTLRHLGNRLRERGADVHRTVAANTWRIEFPPTVEEYLQLLSKSHRKQLRQLKRRFLETGQAVLKTVVGLEQIETGWRILADLHQRRMESLGKLGCFKSDTFARFHRVATEELFRAGRLRLHWLELSGRPIAAEYHLAGDGMIFAYQGGIEPDALDQEPGRLITLALLERAMEEGYRAFDFCRGDEPYKAHWRAQPRENITLRVINNHPTSRWRHRVWVAGRAARRWLKGGWQLAQGG